MARQRMTSPEIFVHEHLNELHPLTRWAFLAIKAVADREGRLEDRPGRLRVQCVPHDPVTAGEFDRMLWDLTDAGLLTRYTVAGRDYIQVNEWDQHPHHREIESLIPPCDQGVTRAQGEPQASPRLALGKPATSLSESESESESESDNGSTGAGAPAAVMAAAKKSVRSKPTDNSPRNLNTPENRGPIDDYNEIFNAHVRYTPGNFRAVVRAYAEGYTRDLMREVFVAVQARASPHAKWCADNNREFEYLIRPTYRKAGADLVQATMDRILNELATGRRQN